MMFSSIRSRFIAGFMTLGIAPVLLIALLVGKVSYFSHLDSALHHQQEVAKGVGERLAGQLKQLHANLRVLDDYFGLASQPRERQRELLRILLGDSRQFAELTLFDDNGQELLHLSSYRIISEETLVNRRDEELFRIPHRLLQDYAGVIEFDIETGEPGIEIAIPLIDLKSGQSNGVLSATVQLYGMWDLIREVNRTPDEDIYVLDENGRLIAHRNPSLVLRSKEFKPKFEAHRPQPSLTGGSAIIGMYPIQFGSQQLSLVAEVTEASALAPAYDSIRTILVVMLLSLLLATVLIWLGIQHIIHPIESLSSTVRAIRDGDLNRRIEVQMDDEIGELSDTINQMAATLVSNMHSLAESEERYRLLIEHQNDLVVKFDQHGHLLFVSPSFCNTFGKSSDELLGSRFIPRVHEDDRSGVAASLARLSQPPYTSRHEERALTVAGWRWFSWSARAVLGAQGRVQQVISVGRDITEQKQAEQQLRESEERIRLLLDSTGDGIFGVDREGCCTFINAAALRLLGYESNAEMIGQRMHDLIHYQRADGALLSWKTCPVCTTIESASASHSDNDLLWRRDGSSFPAELHAHPLRHDAQVVGAVVTFSDISERQVLLDHRPDPPHLLRRTG